MHNPNDISHLWELEISIHGKNVFQVFTIAPSDILLFFRIKFWGTSMNYVDVGFSVLQTAILS